MRLLLMNVIVKAVSYILKDKWGTGLHSCATFSFPPFPLLLIFVGFFLDFVEFKGEFVKSTESVLFNFFWKMKLNRLFSNPFGLKAELNRLCLIFYGTITENRSELVLFYNPFGLKMELNRFNFFMENGTDSVFFRILFDEK